MCFYVQNWYSTDLSEKITKHKTAQSGPRLPISSNLHRDDGGGSLNSAISSFLDKCLEAIHDNVQARQPSPKFCIKLLSITTLGYAGNKIFAVWNRANSDLQDTVPKMISNHSSPARVPSKSDIQLPRTVR